MTSWHLDPSGRWCASVRWRGGPPGAVALQDGKDPAMLWREETGDHRNITPQQGGPRLQALSPCPVQKGHAHGRPGLRPREATGQTRTH